MAQTPEQRARQDIAAERAAQDKLPLPDVIGAEIADDLESALEQFTKIAARLRKQA